VREVLDGMRTTRNMSTETTPRNPFGISREEILNLAAQKLADEFCHEESDLQTMASKLVEKRVSEALAESMKTRINSFMDAEMERLVQQVIVPVDMWGDATGKPTTIRESLAAKAVKYWSEKVDNEGKLNDSSYYGKPRHEWLFRKIVGEEFEKAVKQNIVNLIAAFKDAVRESEKNKIDSYLNEFLKVKSNGDK